jgi:hypothetical protein
VKRIREKMKKITKEEILEKLEEKIQGSGVGIELWFSATAYKIEVVDGKKTFEEWFQEILENS